MTVSVVMAGLMPIHALLIITPVICYIMKVRALRNGRLKDVRHGALGGFHVNETGADFRDGGSRHDDPVNNVS